MLAGNGNELQWNITRTDWNLVSTSAQNAELLQRFDPRKAQKDVRQRHKPRMTFPTATCCLCTAAHQLFEFPQRGGHFRGFSLSALLFSPTPIRNLACHSSVPLTKGTAEDLDVRPKWLHSGCLLHIPSSLCSSFIWLCGVDIIVYLKVFTS